MDERVVFGSTFEALIKALGPLEPQLDAGIRALKITPGGPYQAAYPLETWTALLREIVQARYSGLDEMTAYSEVGRTMIRGMDQTLIGKAIVAAMRLLGPKRTLGRMTRNFRSANNYSEFKTTELGPTEAEVWCNYVIKPGFYRGVLLEGVTLAGAKGLSVDFVAKEGDAAVYRLKWAA